MTRARYQIIETSSPHFEYGLYGAYQERLIRNCMTTPVIVIERSGKQTTIPPMSTSGSHGVIVTLRELVGIRSNDRSGDEVPIPSKLITIPDWEMLQDPVYVPELDVLLCTSNHAHTAVHPYNSQVYKEALQETINLLADNDYHLTMRVFANDPTAQTDRLYVHMFGKTLMIPITEYTGNEALITFVFMAKNEVVHRFTKPLSCITEEGDGRLELTNGFVLHISNNLEKLERSLKLVTESEALTVDQVALKVKEMIAAHKQMVQQLEQQHELSLQAKAIELADKTNQINQQAQTISQQKTQIAEWTAIYEARLAEEKQREAQAKTKTAQLSYQSEEFKYKSLLIKTAGAAAIAIGTWALKVYLDKRKNDK